MKNKFDDEFARQFEEIFLTLPFGLVLVERKTGTIARANIAAQKLISATETELAGKKCKDFFCSPETDSSACPCLSENMIGRKIEEKLITAKGKRKHVLKTVTPLKVGRARYILQNMVDISEFKNFEKRLHNQLNETEALLAAISSILVEIDSFDYVKRWNPQAESTFNIPAQRAVGISIWDLPIRLDLQEVRKGVEVCRNTEKAYRAKDIDFRRPDGSKGILGLTMSPFFDEKKEVACILIMGADITDRKNLESQLAQAQKLESIGQLAAGIAHEINTPIQYVGDNTDFLKQAFEDVFLVIEKYRELTEIISRGDDPYACMEEIAKVREDADFEFLKEEVPIALEQTLQGVERVSKIVRSMKEFSYPGSEEKIAMDINKALDSTLVIAHNEYKYVADAVTDYEKNLPFVNCYPGEMNQVFLNIIINAAHAIEEIIDENSTEKGTITVRTRKKDNYVCIDITDTGKGISKKDLPHIYDPFYTTKEVGKGTGQGLALAYATVVEKHGGRLTCETKSGKGSTFSIGLPL